MRDNALRVILSPGSITPADQPQAVDPALPPGVHANQPESAGDRRVIDTQHQPKSAHFPPPRHPKRKLDAMEGLSRSSDMPAKYAAADRWEEVETDHSRTVGRGTAIAAGGEVREDSAPTSAWSADEDRCGNSDSDASIGSSDQQKVRANLCTILRGAVQPVANGRFTNADDPQTLQCLKDGRHLLLMPEDFEKEQAMVPDEREQSLQKGNPCYEDATKNFWFRLKRTNLNMKNATKPSNLTGFDGWTTTLNPEDKLMDVRKPKQGEVEPHLVKAYRTSLEQYRRCNKLKPILKKMHEISQVNTDVVLTCGIGILRKKLSDGNCINCSLLEIDLHIKEQGDCFELGPTYVLDGCTEIRLCQSLSQLEDPQTLPEKHTFQKKSQQILEHFRRSRHNGPINPFDSSTYKSLLKRIGRAIDLAGEFLKPTPWASLSRDNQKFLLCNEACLPQLQIYDTWILFERKRPETSTIVSLDAGRFLDKLVIHQSKFHRYGNTSRRKKCFRLARKSSSLNPVISSSRCNKTNSN